MECNGVDAGGVAASLIVNVEPQSRYKTKNFQWIKKRC